MILHGNGLSLALKTAVALSHPFQGARRKHAGVRNAGAIGTREYERKSTFRVLCLPVASCCQLGGAETSVRRRFLGSSQSKPLACLYLIKWSVGSEAQ